MKYNQNYVYLYLGIIGMLEIQIKVFTGEYITSTRKNDF